VLPVLHEAEADAPLKSVEAQFEQCVSVIRKAVGTSSTR